MTPQNQNVGPQGATVANDQAIIAVAFFAASVLVAAFAVCLALAPALGIRNETLPAPLGPPPAPEVADVCAKFGAVCIHEIPAPPDGVIRYVTAYNSVKEQTDSTPCIAADGGNICRRAADGEKICAANFVPFGTRLRITDSEGESFECVVHDRLARRFGQRVDVFMGHDVARARRFGKQRLLVTVVR